MTLGSVSRVVGTARPLRSMQRFPSSTIVRAARTYATTTSAKSKEVVNIVEVGPRDGLQNEKGIISVETKIELVNRLARSGSKVIEAGSFVSPKWVPQMAGTAEVMNKIDVAPGVKYQVLVPNMKGLEGVFSLLDAYPGPKRPIDEIAIFTAATDAFSQANTNCTVAESLERLAPVTRAALERGLKVRGYVSVVITCPYSGKVDAGKVSEVTRELFEMGCYEVSLGDTVGTGNPTSVGAMLETVFKANPVEKLAGHFHDTFGMGVANAMKAVDMGIRTLDSSIAGLGGCPYSPGATGNVATEDILYALKDTRFTAAGDLEQLVDVGFWISDKLGRNNESRVAKAIRARRERERSMKAKL